LLLPPPKNYKISSAFSYNFISALTLKVPQAVEDFMKDMGKPKPYGKVRVDGWRKQYAAAGFAEGKAFDPTRRLGGRAG
jgi:hypothetical protein